MIRQRINLRTPVLASLVRALTLLLALALFWYGLMVVLLAVKVSPHTVNALSAYRTLYDDAATLKSSDFSTAGRLVAGFGGLIAFLIFIYLGSRAWPRPYLARGEVTLEEHERGATVIQPARSSASPSSPLATTQRSPRPPDGSATKRSTSISPSGAQAPPQRRSVTCASA
jgi:hypothetical protein